MEVRAKKTGVDHTSRRQGRNVIKIGCRCTAQDDQQHRPSQYRGDRWQLAAAQRHADPWTKGLFLRHVVDPPKLIENLDGRHFFCPAPSSGRGKDFAHEVNASAGWRMW